MKKTPVFSYVAGFGIALLVVIGLFVVTMAQSPANADRSIPVHKVDLTQTDSRTIPVTINININEKVSGLALDENVPVGWKIADIENDGAFFKESEVQWVWLAGLNEDATKTIEYDLTLPDDVPQGVYKIDGTIQTGSNSILSSVEGGSSIEVVKTYPLTTNTTGGGNGAIVRSPNKDRYQKGKVVTVEVDPGKGSEFSGWSGDLTGMTASQDLVMNSAKSVTATFDLKEYQVSLSVSPSGSGTVSGGGTYTYGASVELSASPNVGYEFVNWSAGGSAVGTDRSKTLSNLSRNWDLQANFEVKTYQLTTSTGEGGSITPEGSVSVDHGESYKFEITPDNNYRIDDVTVDGASIMENVTIGDTGTGTYTIENVQSDHTVHATFAPVKRTLNLNFIGAGSGTIEITANGETVVYDGGISVKFDHGTSLTLVASPKPGSAFSDYLGDFNKSESTLEILLDSNIKLNLKFDLTVPYVVSRWDRGRGRVKSNDDPSISLRQILTAIRWWVNEDHVPGTGGKKISLDDVLDLIFYWAKGARIASQGNGPMAMRSDPDNLSAGGSEDYLKYITHRVSSDKLKERKPVEVNISFTPTRSIDGLAVNYPVPEGWNLEPADKDGSNYKEKKNQFLWLSLEAGERKSIAFDLIPPTNSINGNYNLTGELKSSSPELERSIKPLTVTIGQPTDLSLRSAIAYPNPVSTKDSVRFKADGKGVVATSLQVYNMAGKKVHSAQETGTDTITWNLTNEEGTRVPNGTYLYIIGVEGHNGKTARSNLRKLIVVN